MNPVLTDWLTVATAGPTVDGREIKEQWLKDAAETYDREEYTAFLNVEHWAGNLGTVWEVRLAKDKKNRTILQARIRPNKYYLNQNAEDYRLCFSVELTHNFAQTDKTYLTGLATTDYPASLGTTEARFSRKENDPDVFRTEPVAIDMGKPVELPESRFVACLMTAIENIFTTSKKNKEENNMTAEEMTAAFEKAVKPLAEGIADLGRKLDDFSKKTAKTDAEPPKDENFSAEDTLKEIAESVKGLAAEFAELKKGQGKNLTPGTGKENEEPLI